MYTIKTLFLLLIPFVLYLTNAQSIKSYEEGPLKIDDFLGEPERSSDLVGQTLIKLEYYTDEIVRNDTTFVFANTKNYLDKSTSWILKDESKFQTLEYFQVLFDIREFYRRQLQNEINTLTERQEFNELMQSYYDKGTLEIQRFQIESEYGVKEDIVQKWSLMLYQRLSQSNEFEIPSVRDKHWGFGGSLYYTNSFSSGNMSDKLNTAYAGFGFSLDVIYKDYYLFLNAFLAWGTVKEDFIYEENWKKGLTVGMANANLSIGYPIIDNSTHKLIPYLGYGLNEVSYPDTEGVEDGLTVNSTGVHTGFWYDYNLFSDIELIPNVGFGGAKFSNQQYIRFGVNVSRVNNDIYSGYSFNFTLGYSVMARTVETY
ncbi:MAG: hypothetical protein ACE364_00300 [Chlorobiota bacterium]